MDWESYIKGYLTGVALHCHVRPAGISDDASANAVAEDSGRSADPSDNTLQNADAPS